jgi:hypothetical protein
VLRHVCWSKCSLACCEPECMCWPSHESLVTQQCEAFMSRVQQQVCVSNCLRKKAYM